jgi:hypothetical protein
MAVPLNLYEQQKRNVGRTRLGTCHPEERSDEGSAPVFFMTREDSSLRSE